MTSGGSGGTRVALRPAAVSAVCALGVFAAGYLVGLALSVAAAVPVAAEAASATPSTHAGAAAPTPAHSASTRRDSLSPRMGTLSLPSQKSYDLRPYIGQVVNSGPAERRKVALTFDDGPTSNTLEILETLKRHGAHATFFFIGSRMVGHEDEVRAVVAQGSQVCNHTWGHAAFIGYSPAHVQEEIGQGQAEIERVTGVRNMFVRPKGGLYDSTALAVVRKMGLILVGWDVETDDTFEVGNSADQIERIGVRQAKDGSIILYHEMNPATLEALPGTLEQLRAEGYEFVTLAQLLGER